MKERVDAETPKIIKDILELPYKEFPKLLKIQNDIVSDIGCGELFAPLKVKEIYRFDKVNIPGIISTDLPSGLSKYDDNIFDTTFCFQFIEHITEENQILLLKELDRLTKKHIVIGSVSKSGPQYANDILIYKGKYNQYHVRELDIEDFIQLFKECNLMKYRIYPLYSIIRNNSVQLEYGLNKEKAIDNHFIISKV